MPQKRWWRWSVFGVGVLASASGRDSGPATKSPAPPSFFLQDASSDGLCLGAGVFQRCGVDTLWYVTGSPGSYSVHKRSLEGTEASGDAACLVWCRNAIAQPRLPRSRARADIRIPPPCMDPLKTWRMHAWRENRIQGRYVFKMVCKIFEACLDRD